MAGAPVIKDRILPLLQEAGEQGLRLRDVVQALGLEYGKVNQCMLRLREANLVHRGSYMDRADTQGSGKVPAYWVYGPGEDAPYPALSRREAAKAIKASKERYRRKFRAVLKLKTRLRRGKAPNPWQGLL